MISAKTREMLNSLHELTFSTTADSVEAGYIREDYYAVVQVEGQYREFIIDSIVESDDSDLIKEVKASLSSIELNDTLLENKVNGSDPRLLLTSILSATRWSVGTVETGIYNRNFTEDVQFMTALEAIHTLAEFYNCDLHFSYIIDGNKVVKRSVNLFVRLGSSDGKRFEIDKDITSIEREIDTTSLKTAVYPIMKTEDDDGKTVLTTIANVSWSKAAGDPVDKPLGQKFIGDPVALQNWGRLDKNGNLRHRMKLYEFTEEVTVAQMLSMAWVNLAKYTSPKVTYTANVVDLYSLLGEEYLHEKVVIGDTVTVIDRYFAVPIEISDRVIEIERDLLDPSNTVVTVGSESKSYNSDRGGRDQALNDKIDAVNKNAVSALESANGKNTIYYGSLEPAKPNTGDTWFRPHPDNPEEQQMLVWDGVQWIVELDTSDLTAITDKVTELEHETTVATGKAEEAINNANQAVADLIALGNQVEYIESNVQIVQNEKEDKTVVAQLADLWQQTTDLANGHTGQISNLGDQINLRLTKEQVAAEILKDNEVLDTRNTNEPPSWYITNYPKQTVRELKQNSSIGLSGAGTYSTVTTDIRWSDSSGGAVEQTAKADNGVYQRRGTGTSWSSWARVADTSNILSQINLSTEGVLIQGKNIWLDGNTKINNAVIKTAHIADLAVSGAKIANASITSAKIISLDASKITAGTINTSLVNVIATSGNKRVQIKGDGLSAIDANGKLRLAIGVQDMAGDGQSDPSNVLFYTGNGNRSFSIGTNVADTLVIGTEAWNQYMLFRTPTQIAIESSDIRLIPRGTTYNDYFRIGTRELGGVVHPTLFVDRPNAGILGTGSYWLNTIYVTTAAVRNLVVGYGVENPQEGDLFVGKITGTAGMRSLAVYNRSWSGASNVGVTNEGVFYRSTSARKYKEDITEAFEIISNAKKVLNIRPVSWLDKTDLKNTGTSLRYHGFIADEFHELGLTEVVQYGADGQVEGLAYDRISMYHNVILQDHEQQLSTVTQQLTTVATERLQHSLLLESKLLSLENTVLQLQQEIEQLRTA